MPDDAEIAAYIERRIARLIAEQCSAKADHHDGGIGPVVADGFIRFRFAGL